MELATSVTEDDAARDTEAALDFLAEQLLASTLAADIP
jgi:hypothetical protein